MRHETALTGGHVAAHHSILDLQEMAPSSSICSAGCCAHRCGCACLEALCDAADCSARRLRQHTHIPDVSHTVLLYMKDSAPVQLQMVSYQDPVQCRVHHASPHHMRTSLSCQRRTPYVEVLKVIAPRYLAGLVSTHG